MSEAGDINDDPGADDHGLGHEKERGAEKAGKGLGLQREPVPAKNRTQMGVRQVEAEMVFVLLRTGGSIGWIVHKRLGSVHSRLFSFARKVGQPDLSAENQGSFKGERTGGRPTWPQTPSIARVKC